MATIESNIEAALVARVATLDQMSSLTLLPVLPIAWPNKSFTPPATPYLRVSLFYNTVTQITIGDAGLNRYRGLLQVSVFWPLNAAASPAIEVAGLIAKHFKRGTVLSAGGLYIRMHRPPVVASMIVEATKIQVPVTVSWLCDAPNPS